MMKFFYKFHLDTVVCKKKKKKKKKKKGTHTHAHTHTHKSLNLLIIFSSNKKSLTASLKLQYCKE